ncbi:MAG: extracellular solute-binding protein [Mesorhizobium sp.]
MKITMALGVAISALCISTAALAMDADKEKALYEAAKQEGSLTWYTAQFDQNMTAVIGNAFSEKYPGIKVNGIKATAQVSFQRLLLEIKAGQPLADVFSSTDVSQFPQLKGMGALEAYKPANESEIIPEYRNLDPEGYYTTTLVSLIGIVYNTDKVSEADVPKNWTDLTDAAWAGKGAYGDPNYSGMVGVWTVAMADKYGWDFFEKLAKTDPQIGRSIDDAVTLLNSGERLVGIGDPSTALQSAAKGNPVGVVYPSDGTVAVKFPSAILKGSKSPNAAKLFMEFLLSKDVMKIAGEAFLPSIRPDVTPSSGTKTLDDLRVIAPTPEDVAARVAGNREKWRDTFGM